MKSVERQQVGGKVSIRIGTIGEEPTGDSASLPGDGSLYRHTERRGVRLMERLAALAKAPRSSVKNGRGGDGRQDLRFHVGQRA